MSILTNVKNIFLASALVLTAAIPATAQRLVPPQSHNREHSQLLANQRPMNTNLKKQANDRLMQEVQEREGIEDNEIFTKYWASQSVNPYGAIAIPQHKNINVEGFVCPVPGRVTSPYGWRARFGRMHRGVDLSLSVGDTVRSAFSGKIRLTKFEGKGYGYYVVVRHDNGMETVYGHLSKFLVKPNQRVEAGQPIALGGNTGRSTGPHLHFETRYLGLAINPEAIIDFTNKVTHKDVFAFNKASYEKSQNYRPASSKSNKVTASKGKTSTKAKASKTKHNDRKAKRKSRRR